MDVGDHGHVPEIFRSPEGSVVLDDRHFPVIITKWIGTLTEDQMRAYFEHTAQLLGRAKMEGLKVLQVSDATETERPPATVRKAISELNDVQTEHFGDVVLKPNYVAMDNVLLRGTVTAINWISRNALDVEAHRDMPSTLEAALARLDSEGQARPPGLDPKTYRSPELDKTA